MADHHVMFQGFGQNSVCIEITFLELLFKWCFKKWIIYAYTFSLGRSWSCVITKLFFWMLILKLSGIQESNFRMPIETPFSLWQSKAPPGFQSILQTVALPRRQPLAKPLSFCRRARGGTRTSFSQCVHHPQHFAARHMWECMIPTTWNSCQRVRQDIHPGEWAGI